MLDNGGTDPDFTGVYQELGPTCTAGAGRERGLLHRRLWRAHLSPSRRDQHADERSQYFTQDFLDERPLNCVTAYMLAAFCAWDGGKMPTRQQIDFAWGAEKFPVGRGAPPVTHYAYPARPDAEAWGQGVVRRVPGRPVRRPLPFASRAPAANYNYNYWGGILSTTRAEGHDYSIRIAQPGRFPNGNGPLGPRRPRRRGLQRDRHRRQRRLLVTQRLVAGSPSRTNTELAQRRRDEQVLGDGRALRALRG